MKKILGFVFMLWLGCAASAQAQTQASQRGQDMNVYGENADKPVSPYANTGSGFTVTKYKESKVTRKLRRGEARSRLSVPQPKGKPLKHKKKHKFLFLG